jgi:hypothetical protein
MERRPSFTFDPDTTATLVDFVGKKQPPRVVTQTPSPGTPVLEGMTIQIHAVSDSDIPLGVLDVAIPVLVKKISVADLGDIIDSDPDFMRAVVAGSADPRVTEKLNAELRLRGVAGALSVEEAGGLMKSLKELGFGGP